MVQLGLPPSVEEFPGQIAHDHGRKAEGNHRPERWVGKEMEVHLSEAFGEER